MTINLNVKMYDIIHVDGVEYKYLPYSESLKSG
jgi:hypothetical protein